MSPRYALDHREILEETDTKAPTESWSQRRLEQLDPYEHDFQEFKSSEWLVQDGELQSDFPLLLSKQVSAFTNGAGGILVIGIRDNGTLDQGVNAHLKGGTREWLEDIVSTSVTPTLHRFNVYEVLLEHNAPQDPPQDPHRDHTSESRAIYILDLPRSDDAPHQAKDHRYYLRIAGKSRPMSHLHLEDVIRRNSLPRVDISRLGPYGEAEVDLHDERGPRSFVMLRAFLHNQGRVMAKHVGIELTLPRVFIGKEVRARMDILDQTHFTQRPGEGAFFRYHPTPLFPTQEVFALCIWVCIHRNNINALKSDALLKWSVYAGDAVPTKGNVSLSSFPAVRQAMEWIYTQTDP